MKPANKPFPRLPAHDTPDAWPEGELEPSEAYKGLNLVGVDFDHADGVSFSEVRIRRAAIRGLAMVRLDLDDVLLEDCDLSNSDWAQASFRRVLVQDCRLTGLKLHRARVLQSIFRDCQGMYPQFVQTVFKDVRFEGCSLVDANFDEADLRGAVFVGCDLKGATFTGAKLEKTDFRASSLEASRIKVEELRGAIISPHQAITLFERQAGVVVLPEA